MPFNNRNNSGEHVVSIIMRTDCRKHDAEVGMPCWAIPRRFAPSIKAVCGTRISKAGFVGKVTPQSLSLKTPGGRFAPKPRPVFNKS